MIKYIVLGILLVIIYRIFGSSGKRLSPPEDYDSGSFDDSEYVDYEEIE